MIGTLRGNYRGIRRRGMVVAAEVVVVGEGWVGGRRIYDLSK